MHRTSDRQKRFETCPFNFAPHSPDTVQVVLAPYDRVAIGGELLLFKWKALETPDAGPIPTAEEAVMEFKRAIQVTAVVSRQRHTLLSTAPVTCIQGSDVIGGVYHAVATARADLT